MVCLFVCLFSKLYEFVCVWYLSPPWQDRPLQYLCWRPPSSQTPHHGPSQTPWLELILMKTPNQHIGRCFVILSVFFTAMIYPLWGKIQSSKRFQFFSLRHLDSNQRQFLKSCLSTRWECWGSRPKQTRDCNVLLRLSHAPIHPRFRQESYFLERLFGEREQWQTSVLLLVYWSSVLLGPDY